MKKPLTQPFNVDVFNLIIEISPYFYIHVRFMNRIVTNETWNALYFYYSAPTGDYGLGAQRREF
jgi:hypothetical protein